jgi:hypothetical protein
MNEPRRNEIAAVTQWVIEGEGIGQSLAGIGQKLPPDGVIFIGTGK